MKIFDTPIKRADRIFPLPPNKQTTLRKKLITELNGLLSCTN
jgi:hypothetical protein